MVNASSFLNENSRSSGNADPGTVQRPLDFQIRPGFFPHIDDSDSPKNRRPKAAQSRYSIVATRYYFFARSISTTLS